MALLSEEKATLINEHQMHQRDTGSSPVQVALLTTRILQLTAHLQVHRKDKHSQRGLLKLVGQRRRLLRYLQRRDPTRYGQLTARLGLRA
ncbi:MAG: 30S ribosomal protein S15 [Chloroflexi bacterium]|nr:30S ribosomal protein S15 [Chloroflexota bacterium]